MLKTNFKIIDEVFRAYYELFHIEVTIVRHVLVRHDYRTEI